MLDSLLQISAGPPTPSALGTIFLDTLYLLGSPGHFCPWLHHSGVHLVLRVTSTFYLIVSVFVTRIQVHLNPRWFLQIVTLITFGGKIYFLKGLPNVPRIRTWYIIWGIASGPLQSPWEQWYSSKVTTVLDPTTGPESRFDGEVLGYLYVHFHCCWCFRKLKTEEFPFCLLPKLSVCDNRILLPCDAGILLL